MLACDNCLMKHKLLMSIFAEPINSFQGTLQTDNEPIRLSYHMGTHYNSLVDPFKATIGVGLGLPGFQPGQADKNLMKEATRLSENVHLEQVSRHAPVDSYQFRCHFVLIGDDGEGSWITFWKLLLCSVVKRVIV